MLEVRRVLCNRFLMTKCRAESASSVDLPLTVVVGRNQ